MSILKYLTDTAKDKIWQQQSAAFRRFWSEQVISEANGVIPDEVCDPIIRILDRQGKGNTKGIEAVAGGMMMPQNASRKLFNSLHAEVKLARLVESFSEKATWSVRAR